MESKTLIQVVTTLPSEAAALDLARALVDEGLAACGKVAGPITSAYRWQGRMEVAQEWVCTFTTLEANFAKVEQTLVARHPYEVPEIVGRPVSHASAAYAQWVWEACQRKEV